MKVSCNQDRRAVFWDYVSIATKTNNKLVLCHMTRYRPMNSIVYGWFKKTDYCCKLIVGGMIHPVRFNVCGE